MIHTFCSNIISKLTNSKDFSEEDKEKMTFSLSLILSDTSKVILLTFLFFIIIKDMKFLLITFFISTVLRINIGGFHFKKYISCLLFTLLYYLLLLWIHTSYSSNIIMFCLFAISLIIQFTLAPVVSKQRETIRHANKTLFKIKALLISLVVFFLFMASNNPYAKTSIWIVIIQSLFILIQKGVKIYEKNI